MKYNLYKAMVGGHITSMHRATCNLICIGIDLPDHTFVRFHIQTLLRIVYKSKMILSSEDMYVCGFEGENNDFQWDKPGDSLFDLTLEQISPLLLKSPIVRVCPKKTMDLFVYLENGLCLQVLNYTVRDVERYRIFDDHVDHDIIVPDLWE